MKYEFHMHISPYDNYSYFKPEDRYILKVEYNIITSHNEYLAPYKPPYDGDFINSLYNYVMDILMIGF